MKFIHLADLHIGKSVNGFSMLDDQKFILNQILGIIAGEDPDAVLIAGDVYDKSVPSADAVRVLDDFLCTLSRTGCQVFVISGNHDSAERLSFGGRLMEGSGVHIAPAYEGHTEPFVLNDGFGKVFVRMLPFVKPASVRPYFPDAEINSYTDAVRTAIEEMNIDTAQRNVLVAHQFVTGSVRCESEEISVGGCDNVNAAIFKDFDYVALGHIHGPQNAAGECVRYCGTPLKYSFSEAGHRKSVTVAELGEKETAGEKCPLCVRTVPLVPQHDMREIRGSYSEVISLDFYKDTPRDDYLKITLTDEDDVPEGFARLSVIYPNLMKLEYDNRRTRAGKSLSETERTESQSPEELFSEFYLSRNAQPMSAEQSAFVRELMEKIWSDV